MSSNKAIALGLLDGVRLQSIDRNELKKAIAKALDDKDAALDAAVREERKRCATIVCKSDLINPLQAGAIAQAIRRPNTHE